MNLRDYLSQPGSLRVSELRRRLVAAGYLVKSDAQIRQWQHAYGDRMPSPANCVGLELVTDGIVTRQDLRPDDWQLIWPELTDKETEHV